MWAGFWTGDRHIALCKAIVTPVHSQLHCTAQCSCGEETFELTVEQRAVLSSNRPQLVLASSHTLGWPWQGGGATISQPGCTAPASTMHQNCTMCCKRLLSASLHWLLPLPPIQIFVSNPHCEQIPVSKCNEWKTVCGDFDFASTVMCKCL